MAFPTVPTVASGDLLSSTTTTASVTHTFPNLSSLRGGAGPQSGDLLIAICVQYQGNSNNAEYSSWGASFTETLDDAMTTGTGNGALGVAHKTATGSESGTFTVTSVAAFRSVQFLMRIPAGTWHGTTIPEVQTATRAAGAVADPGSFDPTGWAAEDTLWISVAGQTETSTTGNPPTLDSRPANYTDELIVPRAGDAVGHITAGVAFYQLNASSEDVGTWTASNANRGNGIATVIAVRPAPAVTVLYGASVVALTAALTTQGRITTFRGASVVALTNTFTTVAKVAAKGATVAALSTAFTTAAKAVKKGASVVSLTSTLTTQGARRCFGASVVALTATETTVGKVTVKGAATQALTIGVTTSGTSGAGHVTLYGASVVALTATLTSAGHQAVLAHPTADSVDGTWTTQDGGGDLRGAIDEPAYDDADYIRSELNPVQSACRMKLGSLGDPNSSSGHILRWRIAKDASDGRQVDMTLTLRQGGGDVLGAGTQIASFTRSNVSETFASHAEALSSEEADSITDYSDLYVEVEASAA